MRENNMNGLRGNLAYAPAPTKEVHGDMREIEGQIQRVESWIAEAEIGLANMETRLAVVLQPQPLPASEANGIRVKECMQSGMGMRLQALADRLEVHAMAIASIQNRSCV